VQAIGSTTALTTHASIVVSTLSAGSYAIQASFSGDNVYAASTSSTLNQVLTPPSVGMTPTINEVVNDSSFLYPHSRFRNPASSITIRACGFTKPDAGSVVGSAEPHIRLALPQPFFPNQKFSQNQKLKHSALCRNWLLIFRLIRGNHVRECSSRLTLTNLNGRQSND
jgi:hypothetical protein